MNIILYSQQTSNRLSYIIDFFSRRISDDAIIITSDRTTYINADAVKFNYSEQPIVANEICIRPHGLLFQNNILVQNTSCVQWHNLTTFFQTGGDLPFDVFAASFYLISRYEEYLPHEKDMYGRYAHENSLAYKERFLQLPLINIWLTELVKIVKQKFATFNSDHASFNFLPTYDVDIAYAYKYKPVTTQLAGAAKELLSLRWGELSARMKVAAGKTNDPFDTYDWLDSFHKKYALQPFYFFLLAARRKGYDKSIAPYSAGMQKLVKTISKTYDTGIHPSWQSGDDSGELKKEIAALQSIMMKPVTKSRQHYIRMNLPETYRLLLENGIKEDHSMGYGSINGFRASVASAFYWYDLGADKETKLIIRPFCYMEANSFFEQRYSAEQAAEELQKYHDVIKSVNGELITIFHNHFITQQKQWLPWRNMYASFIAKNFDCGC